MNKVFKHTGWCLGLAAMALLGGCMAKPSSTQEGDSSTQTGTVVTTTATTPVAAEDLTESGQATEKVKVYTVQKGDNLWNIARKGEVFSSGWLYPLLFRANADLLKHPDKLEPGTKLIVPRGQSASEIEAAKEEAMSNQYRRNPKAAAVKPVATPVPAKTAVKPAAPAAPVQASPAKPVKPAKPAAKRGGVFWWLLLALLVGGAAWAYFKYFRKRGDSQD